MYKYSVVMRVYDKDGSRKQENSDHEISWCWCMAACYRQAGGGERMRTINQT